MNPEVKSLEIIRIRDEGVFEMRLDGTAVNGVKDYELKSLPDGEPELKLTLNVADLKVALKEA